MTQPQPIPTPSSSGGGGGKGTGSRYSNKDIERVKSRVLSPDQLQRLLVAPCGVFADRDRAILAVTYGLACRASEAVRLDWSMLQWGETIRFWRTKNKDWHSVSPPRRSWRELEKLRLRTGEPCGKLEGPVFLSKTGRRLRPEQLSRLATKAAIAAGLPATKRGIHPLRHTRAVDILRSGGELRHVKSLLGHSSFDTSDIYTHVLTAIETDSISASADF